MKRKPLLLSALILGLILKGTAQQNSYNENVQQYINAYKQLAMAEQKRTGVPAAVKLGQGILETAAGTSELKRNANNHFGIKCKKEWTGETYRYTDDAPHECFRKYASVEDSYRDHSDYLHTGTRYAALFTLPITDYAGWAAGLKRCGYATNPRYTQQLVKIIEDFNLQEYTLLAMKDIDLTTPNAPAVAAEAPTSTNETNTVTTSTITTQTNGKYTYTNREENSPILQKQKTTENQGLLSVHGLKAVQAHKGDVLLETAMKYNMRYARLLELNDLPDAPLEADMYIFLEKKKTKGIHEKHVLKNGETLLQVAQAEGIQLKNLRAYNYLDAHEVPVAGTVLNLWGNAQGKPNTTATQQSKQEMPPQTAPVAYSQADYLPTVPPQTTQLGKTVPPPPIPEEKKSAKTPIPNPIIPKKTNNIADEKSVEEEKQADDIARLKAQMDKAVYKKTTPEKTTVPQQPPTGKQLKESAAQYYIVQKGDTGYSIAQKHHISMRQLIEWNGLQSFNKIKPGQKLKVIP
jgi:flagellum-specific peptidoglycan hydrolase FlgJ